MTRAASDTSLVIYPLPNGQVLYLAILAAIAFLWMPSANSQRYAYSMELATFDPDEEVSWRVCTVTAPSLSTHQTG